MPSSPSYKRNYRQEYKNNQSSTKAKKDRAARNKARSQAVKDGRVKAGDKSKDVDHKKSLKSGGSKAKSNTRVISVKKNRSMGGASVKGSAKNPHKNKKTVAKKKATKKK